MHFILSLSRIIIVCCRSLADVAALTLLRVKISFCPSTICTRTSYWRGLVAGDILIDSTFTITVPRRDG